MLSLWYMTLGWIFVFFICNMSQEVTKEGKKITGIAWKNKERKNRSENENPIMLALMIGQEAVLSLKLSLTRITKNLIH